MTVCQGILLPLFMHQQNNDIVCQGILHKMPWHTMSLFCWCIKSGSKMSWHNMSLFCWCIKSWSKMPWHTMSLTKQWHSMSRHFISTRYASIKQWQYVRAFYFHSLCIQIKTLKRHTSAITICSVDAQSESKMPCHTVIVLLMHTEWK
jgi:hypothetical protein